MKKYTKPSIEIIDLKVEEKITAPTTFYRKGINVLSTTQDVNTTGLVEQNNASF